ncbi:MAG: rhodanese-related sulfurtransferase [Boseongicola sp. SB0673_bin_14]|nr:rhodanese-related sulfurtransferase [Boseongicola sp. SB0667_bin_21]MYI70461.1 rhodanese-related sulfurtransferase [Boseongicola sp. SB0673_bin_14]
MAVVASFYKFTSLEDPARFKPLLFEVASRNEVRGTVLLAREGINGTIAGPRQGIASVFEQIRTLPGCGDIDWRESAATAMPFARLKVRLKREIVTMGRPGVDPVSEAGTYVRPADWNSLIMRDDVAVIDTRNAYEVAIGSFEGAIDPGTSRFRDFPAWWDANGHGFGGKKVAMYCTGGIRCEKATNYLLGQGVEEVFHLRGGILGYLEEVPEEESLWHGECFVFDQRVSVCHGLKEGTHDLCHACRRPLSRDVRDHADYELGVSCPSCVGEFSDGDRARFRERQRQIELARSRGTQHLGQD